MGPVVRFVICLIMGAAGPRAVRNILRACGLEDQAMVSSANLVDSPSSSMPEPGFVLLLAAGMCGLVLISRRKR